jgi:hypothetical protein
MLAALTMLAEEYYPEGTKWTEIRLDTLKYDSWYSKVGDEWVPNFETIEYYVKGEYTTEYGEKYKCVYTNGPEWTDSLTLLIQEAEYNGHNSVLVSVLDDLEGEPYALEPGEAYQFDWSVGSGIFYTDITMSNTTYLVKYHDYYGIIGEIKEGYFGGVRPLKYVDLDGKAPECGKYDNPQLIDTNGGRIIQGIGITEWNDGECLFGPPRPYFAMGLLDDYFENLKRHYRSMLVHFERNGEVLYDVWPESSPQMAYRPFIEDGKVWKVGDITSDNSVQLVEYYYFDGDTIIDGKTCMQMMCQRYVNPDYPNYDAVSQLPSLSYVGAWYEENKQVYFCDATDQQFKLMYDFSLEDNGTFQKNDLPYVYVIGPRKTGGIKGFKGVYRDVLELADGKSYKCAPWMEGVGGIYGNPKNNVFNVELGDPGYYLMSCTVGDEVIYLNDDFEDGATPAEARKKRFDFTHTIKTKPKSRTRSEEDQSLYGEYNEQQLSIHLDPIDDTYLVSITDESGKAVYEKEINAGNIVGLNIDISAYPEGRYTVTVENSQETFTGEFDTQTTGIEVVRNKKEVVDDHIYNLQGQRLSTLQKGLNIVNGQKVYVK